VDKQYRSEEIEIPYRMASMTRLRSIKENRSNN